MNRTSPQRRLAEAYGDVGYSPEEEIGQHSANLASELKPFVGQPCKLHPETATRAGFDPQQWLTIANIVPSSSRPGDVSFVVKCGEQSVKVRADSIVSCYSPSARDGIREIYDILGF